MSNKFNHRVIYLSIFLIFIPFILITNLYPLMRVGMFAQPINQETGIEVYYLKGINSNSIDTPIILSEVESGIPAHVLNYLIRNHIARGKDTDLIFKLRSNPLLAKYYKIEIWKKSVFGKRVSNDLILGSKIVE